MSRSGSAVSFATTREFILHGGNLVAFYIIDDS